MRRRLRTVLAASTVTVALAASAPAGAVATPHVVAIVAFSYKPASVTLTRGSKITFVNLDSAILTQHTASYPVGCHFGTCVWTTPILFTTKPEAQVTINLPRGTYTFYCQIHPQIRGTLHVT